MPSGYKANMSTHHLLDPAYYDLTAIPAGELTPETLPGMRANP